MTHALSKSARTCLVVDDEPRLRQALSRLMKGDGFTVFEAGSGGEALTILAREPVALVLSDMRMPGMAGSELLREVRLRHPDVAFVLITAVAEVEVAVECLSAGAMDYITKPFVFEEVRARVEQALEKRRLMRENRDYQERLEERVREQAERLEQTFLAGVQSLAEALELKDPYTRGHSVRVSQYSGAIARMLGIAESVVRNIELGGQLHDIGKIGVREDVLNKAGPLTRDEYEHIMTHPLLGWRVLRPLLSDNPVVLNVVRSHHERLDGTGVPDGLVGADIPREARIVSVADAFDAMMSKRPYRQGLSYDAALTELRRMADTQFDPEVVDALLEVVAEGSIDLGDRGLGVAEAKKLLGQYSCKD
ncbi:MAG TPA: HD domain-containing phosphohydrolase [Gemmatimonadaceae bacterium]|nr:HD domain-containing phosphohydrolase [Gemmatimonadaceae bacterium]